MNKRTDSSEYGFGRTMDTHALCAYLGLGQYAARDIAQNAGAIIKVGRRVVYDRMKIDAYMDSLTAEGVK